jgi:hypothetical protein
MTRLGFWLSREPIRVTAWDLIDRYNVKNAVDRDSDSRSLGGNVPRAVLARELSDDADGSDWRFEFAGKTRNMC